MKEIIWTTADGRKIPVCDMTEAHAKNALRMLLREQQREEVEIDMSDMVIGGRDQYGSLE